VADILMRRGLDASTIQAALAMVVLCRSCETKSGEFVFVVRQPLKAGDVCRRIFAAMTAGNVRLILSALSCSRVMSCSSPPCPYNPILVLCTSISLYRLLPRCVETACEVLFCWPMFVCLKFCLQYYRKTVYSYSCHHKTSTIDRQWLKDDACHFG